MTTTTPADPGRGPKGAGTIISPARPAATVSARADIAASLRKESQQPPGTGAGRTTSIDGVLDQLPAVPASIANAAIALRSVSDRLHAIAATMTAAGADNAFMAATLDRIEVDGPGVLDGFGDDLEARHHALAAGERLQNALGSIETSLRARLRNRINDDSGPIMDALATQLAAVRDRASSAAAQLDGLDIDDPAAVAAASDTQRTALLELRGMRHDYEAIRTSQRALYNATGRPPYTTPHAPRPDSWADVFETRAHEFKWTTHASAPAPYNEARWWVELLRRSDAWCPTPNQLREHWATLREQNHAQVRRAG